ncbi:MAG: DnaD domain protein [Ruminococcaceae bacterium]|nr:DnaD domain protein [Oscillospiraceae bacterium]
MKIIPQYKNKILSLPGEVISEKLPTASKDELKVLLAVFMEHEFELSELATKLDMTENAVKRAMNSWEKTGVIVVEKEKTSKKSTKSKESAKQDSSKSTSRNDNKVVNVDRSTLPHYTSGEIAAVVEKRNGCSELLDSCQQILGKMFNAAETSIIVGLVDHLSLSNDYIMLLCSHACSMDKKSVRYVEKLALNFFDNNILTYSELEAELRSIEKRASVENYVRNLFGIGKRALIKKEKEYVSKWTDSYNFSNEMIELAYEITVAKTNEPKLSYANAILENWYAAGYKTTSDVKAAEEEWSKNKAKSIDSSFSTDDFYEAALMRSYQSN